ncbi:MAG: universal stress protein [Actinomycetota bacterium]
MFKKLVVGTDGSDSAERAVTHAATLAKEGAAQLVVVHAYPEARSDAPTTFGAADAYPAAEIGKAILEDVAKHHDEAKIKTVLGQGDAAEVLIDVADQENADLIVVGNKGMTGAKRFVLGSVPNRISHHAPCSVLIVHTT